MFHITCAYNQKHIYLFKVYSGNTRIRCEFCSSIYSGLDFFMPNSFGLMIYSTAWFFMTSTVSRTVLSRVRKMFDGIHYVIKYRNFT